MTCKPEHFRRIYHERRKRAIRELGGCCAECGTTERLEFHHAVPEEKGFDINLNMRMTWPKLRAELDKCQLLCRYHHLEKHGVASLTAEMVSEIKKRFRNNETVASVAEDFPVCSRTIRKIRNGESWVNVA